MGIQALKLGTFPFSCLKKKRKIASFKIARRYDRKKLKKKKKREIKKKVGTNYSERFC